MTAKTRFSAKHLGQNEYYAIVSKRGYILGGALACSRKEAWENVVDADNTKKILTESGYQIAVVEVNVIRRKETK